MRFYDRLRGIETTVLPAHTLLGRWLVTTPADAYADGVRVEPGDYVVPDASVRSVLLAGADRSETTFDRQQIPLDLVATGLRSITTALNKASSNERRWGACTRVVPVVFPEPEQAEMLRLDREIATRLFHVMEVFRQPRTLLRTEAERVPVSRARRAPVQAAEFLSSHTEDWGRQTISAIQPKRILSLNHEDDMDIYENRVATRLVDVLLDYLGNRIEKLNRMAKACEEAADYVSAAESGAHFRTNRIYRLWGEGFDAASAEAIARATLRSLRQLQTKLQGLRGSLLYRAVPRRAHVDTTLRMTNILVNHQHYRHVALLWRAWAETLERPKTPRENYLALQETCQGFASFCAILVARAVIELGLRPAEDRFPSPDGLPLSFGDSHISLSWNRDGTLHLEDSSDGSHLRFIPMVAAITGDPDRIEETIATLEQLTDSENLTSTPTGWRKRSPTPLKVAGSAQQVGIGGPTVILYPGSSLERELLPLRWQRRVAGLGHDDLRGEANSVSLLPVAPMAIDSLERVTQAVTWWFLGRRFLAYPPPLSCPQFKVSELMSLVPATVATAHQQHVKLVRPRSAGEVAQLAAQSGTSEGSETRRPYPASAVRALIREVEQAEGALRALLHCPTCGDTLKSNAFQQRDRDTFFCVCGECKTRWVTRSCGECGARYPVIQIAAPKNQTQANHPEWVARTLGRDVLASPCWIDPALETFICPACRVCPNSAGDEVRRTCRRCFEVESSE